MNGAEHQIVFIGRHDELTTLTDSLSENARATNAARLFCIKAPEHYGKTTLVDQMLKNAAQMHRKRLFIFCKKLEKLEDIDHLSHHLTEALSGNSKDIEKKIQRFGHDWEKALSEIWQQKKPVDEASDNNTLDTWCRLFQEHFFKLEKQEDLQILFTFVGYDQYLVELKSVISQKLIPALKTNSREIDIRFILTSEHSLEENLDLENYWPSFRENHLELELAPLTFEDIEQWLQKQDAPAKLAQELFELTRGIPGKLDEALNELIEREREAEWLLLADQILHNKTPLQQERIRQCAYLPHISPESLCIFQNNSEAFETYQYIKTSSGLSIREQKDGSLILDTEPKKALRKWTEKKLPGEHQKLKTKAETYENICQRIPERSGRNILADLLYFNFFNKELLGIIFPDRADLICGYIQANPQYFERTTGNWKVAAHLHESIQAYRQLIGFEEKAMIKRQIADCWHKRREDIITQSKTTNKTIENFAQSVKTVQGEITKLKKKIKHEENALNKRKASPKSPPQSRNALRKPTMSSVSLQIFGISILYLSILFSSKITILYAAIGVICILMGLFMQTKHIAVTSPNSGQTSQADKERYTKNIHFLTLKRNQLQNQMGEINAEIGKRKNNLKEFDMLLREPYS